ncbi:type II toxin-antitoxin system PemK/MazF family toxin [Myxosarcina sp. GI1]|uniref:type II toxin-antitoxin system PemK/MazF family toxin n=1 Tax=Myxosarcina sp. GI1 TaxID=1541065 RepID=UPI000561F01B|nr:type II toxin-antitoxin system PemK/MazF family toxin [Myxosarcina sp. GI1]
MNSTSSNYRRGDIWWVKLDPGVGVEARKTRACLILQNDLGNRASKITTIVPFLAKRNYSFVVNVLPTPENGLDKERGLHFNQIRSVDRYRLTSKIGKLEELYWNDIKAAIDVQLGFY